MNIKGLEVIDKYNLTDALNFTLKTSKNKKDTKYIKDIIEKVKSGLKYSDIVQDENSSRFICNNSVNLMYLFFRMEYMFELDKSSSKIIVKHRINDREIQCYKYKLDKGLYEIIKDSKEYIEIYSNKLVIHKMNKKIRNGYIKSK